MALALQHANHVPQDTNRIRTVVNEVSKNVSDSNGNFKSWVVKTCWQELSLNGVVYRRFLGETHCLVQRGVLGQPQGSSPGTFMPHGRAGFPRDITLNLSSSPVQLLSLRHGTIEQRVERLVQLLIAFGMSDAPDLPQSAGKEQPRHADSTHSRQVLSPRLLSLLASAVNRLADDVALEESSKAMPDLVRGEKVLPPVDKQGQISETELLQIIDEITSQLIAETAAESKSQQKTARSVVVLSAESPLADKPSLTHSGHHRITDEHPVSMRNNPDATRINPDSVRNSPDSTHNKPVITHNNPVNTRSNPDGPRNNPDSPRIDPDGQKVTNKPVVGAANKPGMSHQAAPVPVSLSTTMPTSALLSTILASAVPAAMQPPPIAESGQKQLPPIILPNVGQGPGSRSERKKSKKERDEEEEEERERSRNPFLFDDEDPLDSEDEE